MAILVYKRRGKTCKNFFCVINILNIFCLWWANVPSEILDAEHNQRASTLKKIYLFSNFFLKAVLAFALGSLCTVLGLIIRLIWHIHQNALLMVFPKCSFHTDLETGLETETKWRTLGFGYL